MAKSQPPTRCFLSRYGPSPIGSWVIRALRAPLSLDHEPYQLKKDPRQGPQTLGILCKFFARAFTFFPFICCTPGFRGTRPPKCPRLSSNISERQRFSTPGQGEAPPPGSHKQPLTSWSQIPLCFTSPNRAGVLRGRKLNTYAKYCTVHAACCYDKKYVGFNQG